MLDKKAAMGIYNSGRDATVRKLLEYDMQVEELKSKVDRLSKNSSNSSKPPSSDIVKPDRAQKRRDKKKRVCGGQLGHPRYERRPFNPEEITEKFAYTLTSCPDCGGKLVKQDKEQSRVIHQVEIRQDPLDRIEHTACGYWCEKCQKIHHAAIPLEIKREGLFKENLSATVCFLKFVGAMSLSGIKKYLLEVYGEKVTKGYLCKVIQKGSKALEQTYNEMFAMLRNEQLVNADETGHNKIDGQRHWVWVFRTPLYAMFKISPSRGSNVLIDVLGTEFNGVLGCDYFSAYRKYMNDFSVQVQFCLAHLIRDVKALVDSHDKSLCIYGNKVLDALRDLFHVIHQRDSMSTEKFAEVLECKKKNVIKAATGYVPARSEAQNLADRFRKHGESYFTFITTPEIDPTNNCAEQAIRFVVMYRHVSQGTRSEKGSIACERFFTVVASCAMQGRSTFQFIKDAFHRYFNDLPPPSLIPDSLQTE